MLMAKKNMYVVKRDGWLETVDLDKITLRLKKLSYALAVTTVTLSSLLRKSLLISIMESPPLNSTI